MEIVKFADARKPHLQHFGIGLGRDRLDLPGAHLQRKAIHRLAPGPKAVITRPAPFRPARHRTLKRMAVHICEARNANGMARIAWPRGNAGFDGGNHPGVKRQTHVTPPAFRHQRLSKMQRAQHFQHSHPREAA